MVALLSYRSVGRPPRVPNDQPRWERDATGWRVPIPRACSACTREEGSKVAVRHLASHDLKGVACDIPDCVRNPVGVIPGRRGA